MRRNRLWTLFVVAVALALVSATPAVACGKKGHRPFGGEQVMVLNIDMATGDHIYRCDEISWFGTIELYGRTYGMALYSMGSEIDGDYMYYEEGWRIFTGKFKVKNGVIADCDPGRAVVTGVDAGVWNMETGYFESEGSVDYAIGRFRRWSGKTVMQNGYAPVPVSAAGLEDVLGLDGQLWLE